VVVLLTNHCSDVFRKVSSNLLHALSNLKSAEASNGYLLTTSHAHVIDEGLDRLRLGLILDVDLLHENNALKELLDLAWDDPTGIGASKVKFSILRLRRKLGCEDVDQCPIESVRGFGYRYRIVSQTSRAIPAGS
jgi:hypothetical protein